ncbi:inositol monophosphatase 2 isoform X1 [Varanus komodoensis]|uniref:Inositol-1-monophosphatase n=1 Tax=Varanus komodoensis TaxID=61221 RepID=A0A8D2LST8_VARKO|nr:inositol monophosphatase 2 isoform X1 [Varanus komodoensis]
MKPSAGRGAAAGGADDPWKECVEVAVQLALRAGQIIQKALTEEKQVSTKTSAADLVTETDHFVENLIVSALKEKFPTHSFIAEEAAAAGSKCILNDGPTWIIDPVDGTCNFVHRFPTVAVSIGFAVNQELEFGVIYHCTEERLYTGRRGQGAYCNDKRLQVSKVTDISKALILTEIGPKRDPDTLKLFLSNMERLLRAQAHGVRVIGSATLALCHLASGAADAYYQFGLHCWDLAAATVIIREAGGVVMDTSGKQMHFSGGGSMDVVLRTSCMTLLSAFSYMTGMLWILWIAISVAESSIVSGRLNAERQGKMKFWK